MRKSNGGAIAPLNIETQRGCFALDCSVRSLLSWIQKRIGGAIKYLQ